MKELNFVACSRDCSLRKMSSPGPLALSACVRAGWPAASQGKDLVAWVQLRRRGSISGASHCRALFPPAGCPLPLRRRCWHAECMHPACSRSYKNLWGANQPQSLDDQHKSPTVRSDLGEHLGSWRLDWEEDGRLNTSLDFFVLQHALCVIVVCLFPNASCLSSLLLCSLLLCRYVEWRRDREEQPEGEKARVQKEWTRFRQSSGRNNAKLWETHEEFGRSGFDRGSQKWWRQRYYDYEVCTRRLTSAHSHSQAFGLGLCNGQNEIILTDCPASCSLSGL